MVVPKKFCTWSEVATSPYYVYIARAVYYFAFINTEVPLAILLLSPPWTHCSMAIGASVWLASLQTEQQKGSCFNLDSLY